MSELRTPVDLEEANASSHADAPLEPKAAEGKPEKTPRQAKWAHARKVACLGLIGFTMTMMCIGIILAGALPAKHPGQVAAFPPTTRQYYISADEVSWTFTPGGKDLILGELFGTYVNHSAEAKYLGGTVIKGHFTQYTDDTFTVCVCVCSFPLAWGRPTT